MFSCDTLCRRPAAFPDLTGLTRAEFDALVRRFEQTIAQHQADAATTRTGRPRHRAAGAGHPFDHDARSRLLMALVWLRIDPTYAVRGFFFDLHKRNAQLHVRAALTILDGLDGPLDRPTRDRPRFRSAAAVMAAFPAVRWVIDGKEQRVNRPTGYDAQKPYYSGKKKSRAEFIDAHQRRNTLWGTPRDGTRPNFFAHAVGINKLGVAWIA